MRNGIKLSYLLLALTLAGCASASVTEEKQNVPINSTRPAQIVVYPFAADSAEVTLNQSIVQRAYRSMSNQDASLQQTKIAHETARSICDEVAAKLNKKGYQAVCQERGTQVAGNNVVVVDGEFTNISEGNRLRRLVIGFGAGAAVLDSSVEVFRKPRTAPARLWTSPPTPTAERCPAQQ